MRFFQANLLTKTSSAFLRQFQLGQNYALNSLKFFSNNICTKSNFTAKLINKSDRQTNIRLFSNVNIVNPLYTNKSDKSSKK